jgi:hypothetical protein
MNSSTFDTAAALTKYVNDNTILQPKIVAIRHVDGRWWLFWYT